MKNLTIHLPRYMLAGLALGWILALTLVGPVASAPESGEAMFYPGASFRFEHFSIDNGLSQNAVTAVLQDRLGYIWIGTQDGLNRYDGYSFTQFRNDPNDPASISGNNISALFEDANGILWVGTNSQGLNRYDPLSGNFTRYLADANTPSSLANPSITSLIQATGGRLWVGTLGGLELLDPVTGRFTYFNNLQSDASALGSAAISTLAQAGGGKIWVGTGALGTPGTGLSSLDPATGKVERITANGACLVSPNISSLLVNTDGSLWVGHGGSGLPGGGLDHINPLTGYCRHYDSDNTDGQFTNDNIVQLAIDRNGRLWVTFRGGGLVYMEASMPGGFTALRHDPSDPDSLSSDNTSSLFLDRSGVLWVGTSDSGLDLLDLQNLQFRVYEHNASDPGSLASNNISAFAESSNGEIWIGTQASGLARFEPSTGSFTYYRNVPSDPASLSSNHIMSLFADQDGTLWVGTLNTGLNHFDPATGKTVRYLHDSGDATSLIDDEVTYILRDNGGILWVATLAGLSRLDPERQNFINYSGLSGAPVNLATDGGDLWIGTWGGGVSRLRLALPGILPADPARLSVMDTFLHDSANPNSLSENSVWAIHKSASGMLWFGTAGGLDRYDPKTGQYKLYDESNGLRNASIACINEDGMGILWVATANGLARFDPREETFQIYDKSDGLQGSEFNANACFFSPSSGDIYVGGTDGFTVFNPDKLVRNSTPPEVVISSFQVLNAPYPFDVQGITPVRLKPAQNFIAFNFAALDYHASSKNTYAYKLEGYDPDWIQAGTDHSVSYTGLRAGDYTFRVKAANSDGTWSTNDASLHFQIIPPFWMQWQFQVGMVTGLVLLLAGGFQWRLVTSRTNARKLEQRVIERTMALNQANEMLREKATQDAVAAERSRLARDLHDAVTQTLFSATLIADVLPDLWEKNHAEGNRRLQELRQLTRGALAEMRTLLVELRPNSLIEIPLPTLLRQLTDALIGRARIDIQLNCSGERKLPPDVQIGLYRIAQESLNNVIKHAHASQAVVTLSMGENVRLAVVDDGSGFDPASIGPDHIGLRIMRERAEALGAQFQVESTADEGTRICVIWK